MKTKELLADSFRTLVLTVPFQKISIKMITDGAHVIRPTFYNYFQDKYEVIEFLFDRDIGSKVEVMIENDMEHEAIKLMFICFEKNKEYYRSEQLRRIFCPLLRRDFFLYSIQTSHEENALRSDHSQVTGTL